MSYLADGYKWDKRYKYGFWDGKIYPYNPDVSTLYSGYLEDLKKFCNEKNYDFLFTEKEKNKIDLRHVNEWLDSLILSNERGNRITLHDHQKRSILASFKEKRLTIVSPTSSGKSLIIYCIIRYILEHNLASKILLIVPTVVLTTQMLNDFKDYSKLNKWDAENNIHIIYGGKEKNTIKPITISVYKSLSNLDDLFYESFDVMITDEAHTANAKTLRTICESLVNCYFRIGLTGTLEHKYEKLIRGLIGKKVEIITTSEMINRKLSSNIKVKLLLIRYNNLDRKECFDVRKVKDKRRSYANEAKFLYSHPKRLKLIIKICEKIVSGNILIVFNNIQYGKLLTDELKNVFPDRVINYVDGSVKVNDRENIRREANGERTITVASIRTFATGVNIKNLHHLFFIVPMKAETTVMQSIGRVLRIADNELNAILWDFADDLTFDGNRNYSLRHSIERVKYYKNSKNNFLVETKVVNFT